MNIHLKYDQHREIINNFIWRSMQLFGKHGIIFLIFIFSAKMLTPYEFGIYNYSLAIIFFLIIFGDFGISTASSKFVSEYNAINKEKLKSVPFNSAIIILALAIVVTILALLIGPWYLKDKFSYVLYLLPLIFLAPMTSLYDGLFRGLKQFRKLAFISLIVGVVSLSFVYVLIKNYGLTGALMSQVIFYFLLFIALSLGYKNFHFRLNKEVIRDIAKYSFIVGIAGIGFFIFTRINILILGKFGFITEIGYYEIINKIFAILVIPATILAQVISPTITEMYTKSQIDILISKYKKYILLSFLLGVILVISTIILFPILLKYFLQQYDSQTLIKILYILSILLITQSISAIASVGFSTSSGYAKLNMYFLLIFGALNIPLSIILIKQIGFFGIIYSTLIIKGLSDISFTYYFFKVLKNETK